MAKIATDIEQSKILKDILPLDSHDMYYEAKNGDLDSEFNLFVGQDIAILKNLFSYRFGYTIPAWSLSALLEHLKQRYYVRLEHDWVSWNITCIEHDAVDDEDTSCMFDDPIDACYGMILILKDYELDKEG